MSSYAEQEKLVPHTQVTITGDLVKTNLLHNDPKKKYPEKNMILSNIKFNNIVTESEKKLVQIIKDHYSYSKYVCLPYKDNKENAPMMIWGSDEILAPETYAEFVNRVGGELAPHQQVTVTFGVFEYNKTRTPKLSQSLKNIEINSTLTPALKAGYQEA